MKIRPGDERDQEHIGALLVDAYEEFASHLSAEAWDRMRSTLRRSPERFGVEPWLVAERDGRLAGAIAYFPPGSVDPKLFDPAWASIRLLGVDPRSRGDGVGRSLACAAIELAREDTAGVVGLHTSELMTGAQALYGSLGFRRHREIPRMFGVRYWVYVLGLDAPASSPP